MVNVKVLSEPSHFLFGGRGVGPNFGSERTGHVEHLEGKLLLTEKTTCFSRRSL